MTTKATGTREWASHSANCISGCAHGCLYCYALSNARRFGTHPGPWTDEVVRLPTRKIGKKRGVVMCPSTHDLTPANAETTIPFLRSLLEVGNKVLVTTKPHPDVIRAIVRDLAAYRDQVMFRFTVGCLDDLRLARWEPGAPSMRQRAEAFGVATKSGWRTSISMEPLLCLSVGETTTAVDSFVITGASEVWIGLLNRGESRLRANGHWTPENARMLTAIEWAWSEDDVRDLVARLADVPQVRWKESIKTIAGLPLQDDASEGEAWAKESP